MNDSSSWWIRTAQSFAGRQYGSVFTPRVGDEVLVVFEEGDPEKPIVVGGVYNGENVPPYPEKEATKYGVRTHSSPQSQGFNECFFDDKAGEEKGYLHLQKDGEVLIENALKHTLDKGDEQRTYVEGSRITSFEAKGEKKGNDTLHLTKGDLKVQLDEGNCEILLSNGAAKFDIKGTVNWQIEKSHTTFIKKDATVTVEGNLIMKVTGNILVQGEKEITFKSNKNVLIQAESNIILKAKQGIEMQSGQNISIQAGKEITQKASGNVTIEAGMNCSTKASMTCKIEGQLNAEVKAGLGVKLGGATIENQAQALFKANAPAILIGGGMVKLG
jgi:type VI secretion system secreted protein VgrG